MATLPPIVEMIRALVAEPSVSSADAELDRSNRAVIDLLAGWCEDAGLEVTLLPSPGVEGKTSLVARKGGLTGGLALAGHTDTVPGDVRGWTSDPFVATERSGALFGLGTADMKGFLAIALHVAADTDADSLRKPLHFVATADEETTMSGARALLAAGLPVADTVVIGEPTGLVPVRMHKGVLVERIRLEGRSGHSSDPRLGRSALEGMHRVMTALMALRDDLVTRHREPAFDVPGPTLNLGKIRGGDSANRICAECELHVDMRLLPGMDLDATRLMLRDTVRGAVAGTDLDVHVDSPFEGIPAFATAADAPIVRLAERVTGTGARAVSFGTEAPFFERLGMSCLVCGPGDIGVAHAPDEHLPLDRIPSTVALLRAMVHEHCMKES